MISLGVVVGTRYVRKKSSLASAATRPVSAMILRVPMLRICLLELSFVAGLGEIRSSLASAPEKSVLVTSVVLVCTWFCMHSGSWDIVEDEILLEGNCISGCCRFRFLVLNVG